MQLDILYYYHHSATCNWTYCITITIVQHATGHTALLSHQYNLQLDILHYYHTSATCNWTYCITITPVQLATVGFTALQTDFGQTSWVYMYVLLSFPELTIHRRNLTAARHRCVVTVKTSTALWQHWC